MQRRADWKVQTTLYTTASLLVWTMLSLCMLRNWQERAREEVFKVCGKEPIFYDLNQLKVVSKHFLS